MSRSPKVTSLLATLALALASSPVAAQDESPEVTDVAGPEIAVSGVDYAFVGLPTSVPAGTTLTFQNDGVEMHEMAVFKINDDETRPLEELLAIPQEEVESVTEQVGFAFATPGMTAPETITLGGPGRYVALCFIPQGMDPAEFIALGVDPANPPADDADIPPEALELFESLQSNPPHMALGMVQEFTVTEEGTEVGPLPDAADGGDEEMDDAGSTEDDSSE